MTRGITSDAINEFPLLLQHCSVLERIPDKNDRCAFTRGSRVDEMAFSTLVIIDLIILLFKGFTSQVTNVTVTFMAKQHTVGNEYHFFFMCLCDGVPLGCSAEFLKNNKTIETLRQFNDSCYHKTAHVCKGDECSCSSDCMNFTYKYNTKENRTGDVFSCKMKIKAEGIWMDIYDSAIFDGKGFVYKSKEKTVTQSGVDESTVKATPKASDTVQDGKNV